MNWSVYVLREPTTREIRYVGITGKSLEERLRGHLTETRHNKHKFNWIRSLKRQGLAPEIQAVETGLTKEQACAAEQRYIQEYREQGYDLVNLTNGGEALMAGRKHKPETLSKMREVHGGDRNHFYGKHHTEGTKERIRQAKQGKPSWNAGKQLTEEHRSKLSESHQGQVAWNKGKHSVDWDMVKRLIGEGRTQTEVAAMLQIDPSHVSRIINGKTDRRKP